MDVEQAANTILEYVRRKVEDGADPMKAWDKLSQTDPYFQKLLKAYMEVRRQADQGKSEQER